MTSQTYRMNVGKFECLVLKDGGGPRVASQFLPSAPQEELDATVRRLDLDPASIEFSINIWCVKTGSHTLLIDTGLGTSNLPEKLLAEGVDPASIDLVVITHGHWDHIGGIMNTAGDFVYPNAQYVISQTEWKHWTQDDRFSEADENPAKGVWQTLKSRSDRVSILSGGDEVEVAPGVCLVAAPGHTVGHSGVLLESNGERLLHIADAGHHWFQLSCPQWSPEFDYDKSQSAVTRRKVFERMARENLILAAYHFPFPGVGRVQQADDAFGWQAL
jgi:glyoxylase-like metal-dependent hydrolase (beta-lactamase superfamily II)